MSGRAPIKIFEYDEFGAHIATFKNMTICRAHHFPDIKGKVPLLTFKRMGVKYSKTKEGNYLVAQRLGRKRGRLLARIDKSEYCTDLITRENTPIQIFNLEGVLLLECRNLNILEKLIRIPRGTARNQLKRNTSIHKGEFIIKYKENDEF